MRKYLSTIHTRSHEHKKRFALLTSGTVTLLIFGIWLMTSFPPNDGRTAAEGDKTEEISPFESLKASVGTALKVFRTDVNDVKKGLETVNSYGR